jgi:hypothetical protein
LTGDGKVGIGATVPAAKLEVSQAVAADGSTPSTIRISGLLNSQGWTVGAEMGKLEFYNSDASSGGVGVRGSVAVVTTSATGVNWDMVFKTSAANAAAAEGLRIKSSSIVQMVAYGAGTATFDASGNISSVSDERLKIKVADLTYGLDAILGINPVLYKYTEESGMDMEAAYPGFFAQNVQSMIPEAVIANRQGLLGLQDRGIIAALVNAVKELNDKITALET